MNTNIKRYIINFAAIACLTVAAGICNACQDDFDNPQLDVPVATQTPNTTISELKHAFWQDDTNYAEEIGTKPDGSHYIIAGTVISSDEPGNVFKSITIQDATGALSFSIDSYNLYLNYRRGQEIVLDVTGMYIGKYAGLQQIGMKEWTEKVTPPSFQVSFMSPQLFNDRAELNGLPALENIDTLVVNSFAELGATPDELMKWQSQLVRFNNVTFQNAGINTFSAYHENVSENLLDINGQQIAVRTSGYSNFWNKTLPEGRLDLVALVGYFNSSWQLTLIDYQGCMNIGNPTTSPGTEDNPYTVDQVVTLVNNGTPANGWVTGWIVGTVAPEVSQVTSDNDIEWSATPELDNTIVIGASADTKSIANAIVISVKSGSDLANYGVLANNPDNYKKQIWIKGTFTKVMSMAGITGNNGTAAEFKIDGLSIDNTIPNGNGTQSSPFNCPQVIAMNPADTTTPAAGQSSVWVAGYIVGYMPTDNSTVLSNTVFSAGDAAPETNLVLAPTPDCTDYTKCIGIQLNTTIRGALNLKAHPENLGLRLDVCGDVLKYCGAPGVKNISQYTLADGGGVTPPPPSGLSTIYSESFASELGKFSVDNVILPEAATYIWAIDSRYSCAKASAFISNTKYASESYLISPTFDLSGATKAEVSFEHAVNYFENPSRDATLWVSVDKGAWQQITINTYGTNSNFTFVSNTTDLAAYAGKKIRVAFRYISSTSAAGTWEVKNFTLKADAGKVIDDGGSGDDPNPPTPPSGEYKGDFDSFNDGATNHMSYSTYTNKTGWTATNSLIIGGSDNEGENSAPKFSFIGKSSTLAVCMNGRKDRIGTITSPTLSGGIKTLTMQYGIPYTDASIRFIVKVLQDGKVVKEQTVEQTSPTKFQAYSFSMDVNITGNFSIIIENAPTTPKDGSNGFRVAVWNLTWTN